MGSSGSGAGTPGASGSSTFYSSSATGHPSLQGVQLNSSGSDMSGSIYNAYGGEIKSGIFVNSNAEKDPHLNGPFIYITLIFHLITNL